MNPFAGYTQNRISLLIFKAILNMFFEMYVNSKKLSEIMIMKKMINI